MPLALPPLQVAEFISGCEKAGLSGVGMHDHQHRGRDTFMTLALAAERTSKLGLYPAVTNPLTCHPMVLAAIANTLQEIAPGRVIFPIGAGWLSAKAIGSPRATVEKLRMTVSMVQRWLAGEQVPVGSTKTRLGSVASSATPVYVAAAGPRMVGLVGEVGDGGFINVGRGGLVCLNSAARFDKWNRAAVR